MNTNKDVGRPAATPLGKPPVKRQVASFTGSPLGTPRDAYYPLSEFLDDQRRVLEALKLGPQSVPRPDRAVDGGRLVFVCLELPGRISSANGRDLTLLFSRKYGPVLGVVRQVRFLGVIRFVTNHSTEIEQNGFGRFESITEVHEELLRHLLNFAVPGPSNVIPPRALLRFYDLWGERWL